MVRETAWFSVVVRIIGMLGTVASVVIFVRSPSFPTPDKLVVFATFVAMIFGQAWPLLKRMIPFVGLLLVYESFRGVAAQLNKHVHYTFMADADKFMVGGHLPTAVLQQWWWSGHVQWYDFVFYLAYMMHFVLPFALAIVVWKLREKRYWEYVVAYMAVSFAGFLTFLAYPAAPPWMSSDMGLIEHIRRVSSDVWFALGVHDFPSVYNRITPNPVAAVPSLHAAYATIFALYVTTLWKGRWRYLAWVYPALIYIGTIYMGEHYLFDELTGALYGVAAFFIAPYLFARMQKGYRVAITWVEAILGRDRTGQ